MRFHRVAWIAAFALWASAACSQGGASATAKDPAKLTEPEQAKTDVARSAGPSVELFPPGRAPVLVGVELARTQSERSRGLMYRKHLDPDAGMLFLFEAPQQLTFWMRNTYVALDMIFIEPTLRVLGVVENAEPLTESHRFVPGASQYVLEVNAGFARKHGIGPGTSVRFQGVSGVPAAPQPGVAQ
jgi:uncharacterized membrane protein (UPF0127 family)